MTCAKCGRRVAPNPNRTDFTHDDPTGAARCNPCQITFCDACGSSAARAAGLRFGRICPSCGASYPDVAPV
jgi:hypothetical protein